MTASRTLREIVVAPSRSSVPATDVSSRWFSNDDFDLFVWFDDLGAIRGFERCSDRSDVERALTWSFSRGYRHSRVDTGEATGLNYDMPVP